MYEISENNEVFFEGLKLDEFILRDDYVGLTPEEIKEEIRIRRLNRLKCHLIDFNYETRIGFPHLIAKLEGMSDETYINRINISIDHIDELIEWDIYCTLKDAFEGITEFNQKFGDRKYDDNNIDSFIMYVKIIRHSLNGFGEESLKLLKEVLNTPFCSPKDIFIKLSKLYGVNFPSPDEIINRLQELGDSDVELYEKANLVSLNGQFCGFYGILKMTKEEYFNELINERNNSITKTNKKN